MMVVLAPGVAPINPICVGGGGGGIGWYGGGGPAGRQSHLVKKVRFLSKLFM